MNKRNFETIKLIHVEIEIGGTVLPVGRLGQTEQGIFFEYDKNFPRQSHDISPFRLREQAGSTAIPAPSHPFEGLHGVFDDSLPDGWGRLLMDRKLQDIGISPRLVSPLDRLAWIGSRGMGALLFKPEYTPLTKDDEGPLDLDGLAEKSRKVLMGTDKDVVDELLRAGGSPGGARPKALIGRSADGTKLIHGATDLPEGFSHWLAKFRAREDEIDAGAVEHAYAEMARDAGVDMRETILLPAERGPGHFAILRFDRNGNRRIHMHTAAGLLNASHRIPSLTYETLFKATKILTKDQRQVDQMFARMAFNVFAHNRDDHTKNHAFLMQDDGSWTVSPAYDLTFSRGAGGEHAVTIDGEGSHPDVENVRAAGRAGGVSNAMVDASIERVREAIDKWPKFAADAGVSKKTAAEIDTVLNGVRAKRPRP